ncbi:MAG: sensor histidine kinase N-terminal domain-containing protein [Gloeobacteraceae cyanobacterium ES-bin-144]|nr:sensor histidine kinase N-terminal domain-containing protein [Verrucomicrobiales bacterium]
MHSIRALLTLRLLIGGILLLATAGFTIYWQTRRALTAEFDAALTTTAQSLISLTELDHGKISLESNPVFMAKFEQADASQFFLLRTSEGKEIQRSAALTSADLTFHEGVFETLLADGRIFRCIGSIFTPTEEDSVRNGTAQAALVVGRERAPLNQTLHTLRIRLLLVGAGALAGLILLVRWGVSRGLAPLARLSESVAKVDADSLATRFPDNELPAELRPISTRLNELLARLESAFHRERRFTATAAHELRTPLAELRTLAEVNLTTNGSEAELSESWKDTLSTTLRMESLALRLLDLTRSENPLHVLKSETFFIADAINTAWKPLARRAEKRGIKLLSEVPYDLCLTTDPSLLDVVFANLLSNAVEHAPPDCEVRISAGETAGKLRIQFQNPAGDLTAEDLPHLFERFWRKENSRSDARHHGLGLALAWEFTRLLGGTLGAEFMSAGAVVFTVEL